MTLPKVSVLSNYYNGMKYIEKAILSFATQTYENTELIITNDASSNQQDVDFLVSLHEKYDFKLYHNSYNLGSARAILNSFHHCSGDYIAFLPQDDYFYSDKISKTMDFMLHNPDYVAVYHGVEVYNHTTNSSEAIDWGLINRLRAQKKLIPYLYMSNVGPLLLQTLLVKKEVVKKDIVPLWSKLLADDWPVNIKLFENYTDKIGFIEEVLAGYRRHDTNLSHQPYAQLALEIDVIAKMTPNALKEKAFMGRLYVFREAIKKINSNPS